MDKFTAYGNRFPFLVQRFLVWLFPGYRRYHEERELQADYDPLTSVMKEIKAKQLFFKEAQLLVREHPVSVTVIFLDLDGFKSVNDNCGHSVGDKVLFHFANLLKTIFRETDIVMRKGGDEFVVFLVNVDIELALASAKRLLETIQKDSDLKVECHGKQFTVTASIGIASGRIFSADNIKDAWARLLINSDIAMYTAKRNGKNRYHKIDDITDFGRPK